MLCPKWRREWWHGGGYHTITYNAAAYTITIPYHTISCKIKCTIPVLLSHQVQISNIPYHCWTHPTIEKVDSTHARCQAAKPNMLSSGRFNSDAWNNKPIVLTYKTCKKWLKIGQYHLNQDHWRLETKSGESTDYRLIFLRQKQPLPSIIFTFRNSIL